jgi:hypothetical protein
MALAAGFALRPLLAIFAPIAVNKFMAAMTPQRTSPALRYEFVT